MDDQEILKLVEEIEDHMEAAKALESTAPPGWNDLFRLCQIVQQLVAQCAAMRKALEEISRTEPEEKPDGTVLGYLVHDAYEMSEIANAALKNDAGCELLDRLRKLESAARSALQALTEGMDDVPVERDKRCAGLRMKAKRALREALGLALEEENDGNF